MNELFLVNMKHINKDSWECFRATHSLASAHDMAKEIREGGHQVNVQSILIDEEGKVKV